MMFPVWMMSSFAGDASTTKRSRFLGAGPAAYSPMLLYFDPWHGHSKPWDGPHHGAAEMDTALEQRHHSPDLDADTGKVIRQPGRRRYDVRPCLRDEHRGDGPVVVERLAEKGVDRSGIHGGPETARQSRPQEGEKAEPQHSGVRAEDRAQSTVEELSAGDTGLFGGGLHQPPLAGHCHRHRLAFLVLDRFVLDGLIVNEWFRFGFGVGGGHRREVEAGGMVGGTGLGGHAIAPIAAGPAPCNGEGCHGCGHRDQRNANEDPVLGTHSKCTQSLRSSKNTPSRHG